MAQPNLAAVLAALMALAVPVGVTPSATRSSASVGQESAALEGRVEHDDAGQRQPVRRAKVTVSRTTSKDTLVAWTDADGRYRLQLTPGHYRTRIEKAGFIAASTNATAVEAALEAIAGRASTVNAVMRRGGAIEGRFLNPAGVALWRMEVVARTEHAAPDSGEVFTTQTDDLGRFRLHTLPPGRYRVSAVPPPPASGDRLFLPGTHNEADAALIEVTGGLTTGFFEVTAPAAPRSPGAEANRETHPVNHAAPKGDAIVAGRVLRADSGQPLADARVDLTTTGMQVRASAWTDAAGAFKLEGLLAGEYFVRANVTGFVNAGANNSLPQGAGVRFVVHPTDKLIEVNVPLHGASAIEATVLDEFGDPAPGVAVHLMSRIYFGGAMYLAPTPAGATGVSDDRGRVRFAGLHASDYYLVVLPEPFAQSAGGFAPTYYPGTSSADAALPITLKPGQDALGLALGLAGTTTAFLTGAVIGVDGLPAAKSGVMIMPAPETTVVPALFIKAQADEGGRFAIRNVPNGRYLVQAGGRGSAGRAVLGTSPTREPSGIVQLRSPGILRGQVRFETVANSSDQPQGLRVRFQPTSLLFASTSGSLYAQVDAEGRFEFRDFIAEGVLDVVNPSGWALARVLHRGRDMTDVPLDAQAEAVTELEVVMTNQLGRVSGVVKSSSGQPVAGAQVVAYPAENPSWLSLARRSRGARTDPQGAFTIADVLPGRYLVVSAATFPGSWVEPAVVSALRPAATPVTVTAHGQATVQLTAVR